MMRSNQDGARVKRLLMRAALALAVLVLLSAPRPALAQHHGGGPGGGFGGGMAGGGPMGGGFGRGEGGDVPRDMGRGSPVRARGGLQLGPPGRWWDDKHFAKQLKLTDDQQHHMDAIFEQNRGTLIKRYEALGIEEQRMDSLAHAKPLDENALFAQIDRVAQARADLEKANTHYLFQLRSELDDSQIARLEAQH